MTPKTIYEIHEALNNIKELENHSGISAVPEKDWLFGSGIAPHRAVMLRAVDSADAAAKSVMQITARQQIKILKDKLKLLGVEFDDTK